MLFGPLPHTALKSDVVPEVCVLHAVPPFVVRTITPPYPTAHRLLASAAYRPSRTLVVPLVWAFHAVPPFVVCRITPIAPVAHRFMASVPTMPHRSSPVPLF